MFDVPCTIRKLRYAFTFALSTIAVPLATSEIFSVIEWSDLENQIRGRLGSLKMALFDRPYTTFYWSANVNIALSGAIFELFDVQ